MIEFDDSYKIRVFDKLACEYYDRNFGSMGKADLETLLFSEYIEYLMGKGMAFDDYTLSKQLGITQSRVSSLKERKELKYPIENNDYWITSFANSVKNARLDKEKNRIIVSIDDVNVRIEVRHYIESLGWYDEYQLNKKLLTIQVDCFVLLCNYLSSDSDIFTKDAEKKIKQLSKKEGAGYAIKNFAADFSKDGLKAFAAEASKQALCDALKLLPFGGTAELLVKAFIGVVEKM